MTLGPPYKVRKADPEELFNPDMFHDCPACGKQFQPAFGLFVEYAGYVCSELCANFFILQLI